MIPSSDDCSMWQVGVLQQSIQIEVNVQCGCDITDILSYLTIWDCNR